MRWRLLNYPRETAQKWRVSVQIRPIGAINDRELNIIFRTFRRFVTKLSSDCVLIKLYPSVIDTAAMTTTLLETENTETVEEHVQRLIDAIQILRPEFRVQL